MNKELSEYEKEMYKFAYECALKGIDIEKTIGAVWGLTREVFKAVIDLTNKNYDYLKKCRNNEKDSDIK